jgi:hypothetical protein
LTVNEIAYLLSLKAIQSLMEKGIGSSIVNFGRSTTSKDMAKKVWYLILAEGSQFDEAIDINSFQNSVLKILNKENTRTTTAVNLFDGGW